MHSGNRDAAGPEQNRPAGSSSEGNSGQKGAIQKTSQLAAGDRNAREPESKKPWASRRADGPSWDDSLPQF